VWALWQLLERAIDPTGLIEEAVVVALPVAFGAAAYLALARVLGVEELDYARGLVLRRFRPG
jgi:hypothetical protein